jgi:membrane protein
VKSCIKHGRELREKYSAENGQDDGESQDGQLAGNGQSDEDHRAPHRDRVREKVQHRAANGDSDDDDRPRSGA